MASPVAPIPVFVKHVAMAIYKGPYLVGTPPVRKFLAALDIARSRLVEWGYLKVGSERGDPTKMVLTSAGMKKEQEHSKEGAEGKQKNEHFDKLYALVAEGLTGDYAPMQLPASKRARQVKAAQSSPKVQGKRGTGVRKARRPAKARVRKAKRR